jgi:hypothetical protein
VRHAVNVARRLLLPLLTALACESPEKTYPIDAVPSDLREPVAAADAAIAALQQRLARRLGDALADGGPRGAAHVCSEEAQALTAAVAREQGLVVGRTSHRVRNPENAPPAWARAHVQRAAAGGSAEPIVVRLDDRVGVLRPIVVAAPCLLCHGTASAIDPTVLAVLHAAYPEDRATGFAEGDLRGFFWAEAPLR